MLSEDQTRWLEALFILVDNSKDVTEWERKFVEDQKARYEEYGDKIRFSEKQMAILNRIDEKVS
jgi:hypothetical protein